MFDLRYHVASLAAVFVALIIGILVGVGLAGSGITKDAELNKEKLQNANLRAALAQSKAQVGALGRAQDAFRLSYPALVADRLAGKHVAVLFVGPVDGGVKGAIERTLSEAGAPPSVRLWSISVPLDTDELESALIARPATVDYVGSDRLGPLGRALGTEFSVGGEAPLWAVLSRRLVEERSGSTRQAADGVVVVRTAAPQQGATARFLGGLLAGLGAAGTPVVGVEATGAATSAVPVFHDRGLSTVDDVDTAAGRLALALLLGGGVRGDYGVKETAGDGVIPPVEPLAVGR